MGRKVGMVHTVASLVPVFGKLASEIMPGVEVIHLVDEGLLKDARASGQLTPSMERRLGLLASFAEESGAEIVMVTCSSIGPCATGAQAFVKVPLIRVDEAMADEAVRTGKRIGVIATLYTTLKPTADLVRQRADVSDRKVEVETLLCEGAFPALEAGDMVTHDRIVREKLKELMGRVDVVVLAQASMARVADQLPAAERKIPILSSPRLGVERLKQRLEALPRKVA